MHTINTTTCVCVCSCAFCPTESETFMVSGSQMIKVDSIAVMKSPAAVEKHDISHH